MFFEFFGQPQIQIFFCEAHRFSFSIAAQISVWLAVVCVSGEARIIQIFRLSTRPICEISLEFSKLLLVLNLGQSCLLRFTFGWLPICS